MIGDCFPSIFFANLIFAVRILKSMVSDKLKKKLHLIFIMRHMSTVIKAIPRSALSFTTSNCFMTENAF